MHKKYFPIGEVSHGTLRSIDLIESMVYFITASKVALSRSERSKVREAQKIINSETPDEEDMFYFVNETLPDIINNHCMPYTYYGSSEGDGACFGVWVNVYVVQEDLDDTFVLEVNDHGNATLKYRCNGRVVWAVV